MMITMKIKVRITVDLLFLYYYFAFLVGFSLFSASVLVDDDDDDGEGVCDGDDNNNNLLCFSTKRRTSVGEILFTIGINLEPFCFLSVHKLNEQIIVIVVWTNLLAPTQIKKQSHRYQSAKINISSDWAVEEKEK